jgi:hypothetical protein
VGIADVASVGLHVEPVHVRRVQVAVKRFANSASAKASFDREVSAAAVAAPLPWRGDKVLVAEGESAAH